MTTAAPKLAVSHLQAGYGDVQVLWDMTLEVGAGELVCLIGSNGAGKTTLMRCISGLLSAIAGGIAVDGRTMTQAQPADFVRAGIAHVPEGRRLFSAMSVRDNLLMGAYLRTDKDRHRRGSGARLCDVSDPRRAAAAGRRHAVGRRAADVRDRARPDGARRAC